MKLIDVSWPVTEEITAYKDKKTVEFLPVKVFPKDQVRQTSLIFSCHSGTHVDAPSHFIENGLNISQIPLEKLSGRAVVLDLTQVNESITEKDLLQQPIKENQILLLKTKNSLLPATGTFHSQFISVEPKAAEYLASQKIKAVGIDYLGIENNQPDHAVHRILLGGGIPIIEGLRLEKVPQGEYFFLCLPLAVQGLEAAPARAVLWKD